MPPKKNFICSRCKLACRDNHDLQKHLDKKKKCVPVETPVEPAVEPKKWHCEPCKSTFSSLGNYNAHLNTKSHKRITSTDITTLTGLGPPPPTEGLNGQTGEEDEEAEPPVQYIAGPCTSSTEPVDIAGPSNSFDEPAGESEGGVNCVLKTLNTSKIRKTDEKPPRVAVLDLISVLTNQTISNSSVTFSRLCQKFPEVTTGCSDFKFRGKGQKFIPVTNAKGAVLIINALPGRTATRLRIEWAGVIVRYLGGDLSLIEEVAHNRNVQENIADDHPLRFFGQDVESHVLPDSVTGVQDLRQPQVYLGSAGPAEDWRDIRRSDGTGFVPRSDQRIFKFGQNDFNTGRHPTHTREYGTWQIIDSVLTDNPPKVERITKDELRNRNELMSAVHKNKTKRDVELIAANPTEYRAIVERIVEIAAECQSVKVNMDYERELTKRLEFEAKIAEANAPIRLLELQLELKRLEMAS